MNEGVKILLERMKTNPEEFVANGLAISSKWGHLISTYLEHLDAEDATALKEGLSKIKQENFTQEVMKQLLAPEEDDSLGKPWYSQRKAGTQLGGATPVQSSGLTLTSDGNGGQVWANIAAATTTTNLQELLAIKAQKELLKVKKSETLYGRLKNYLHSDT